MLYNAYIKHKYEGRGPCLHYHERMFKFQKNETKMQTI